MLKFDNATNRVIYKTNDYDKFVILKENRPTDSTRSRKHIQNLKIRISSKDLSVPIIVNEKFEILEGQHRYYAYKELNLPIAYEIRQGFTIYDIISINNTNLNWDFWDWLVFHKNILCDNNIRPKLK